MVQGEGADGDDDRDVGNASGAALCVDPDDPCAALVRVFPSSRPFNASRLTQSWNAKTRARPKR